MGDAVAGVAAVGFLIVYLLILLVCFAACVVMYVLQGLAIKKMSESCGLRHTWMGFVPFASSYRLGQLAEQKSKSGKKSWPWRHLALGGAIMLTLALFVLEGVVIAETLSLILEGGSELSVGDSMQIYGTFSVGMIFYYLFAIAYNVVLYIIYWKIFSLFSPDNAVLFLLLSIFFSAALPILLFAIRNRTPNLAPAPPSAGGGDADWT